MHKANLHDYLPNIVVYIIYKISTFTFLMLQLSWILQYRDSPTIYISLQKMPFICLQLCNSML